MARNVLTIGFDADDTLWHNERFFKLTQERFADLLRDFTDRDTLHARLLEAERRNLGAYGFGIKGFVLSMIETAIDVTEERVPARVISELIAAGQDMLAHPIELLPHVEDTIAALAESHQILLITKGDLLDQERKLAQSGLGEMFDGVEIVSHKTPQTYRRIFDKHCQGPGHGMMVGNSLASDIRPMIDVGGWAVHVPHDLTWALEEADPPDSARFTALGDLSELLDVVAEIG